MGLPNKFPQISNINGPWSNDDSGLTAAKTPFDYFSQARFNDLIGRAIWQFPINAAFRGSQAQRKVMFYDPRNSPSRSQFSQGYTSPYQYFAAANTWQTPAGQTSRGRRAAQPSVRFASPKAVIVPAMPWS